MPTMRPPRRGVSYSEGLAAAYATAPETEVVLDTLEFRHPSFLDDTGAVMALRVVNDHSPLIAFLEDDAAFNPGEEVEFTRCYFTLKRQSETDSGSMPQLDLSVDNVARILIPYLDQTKESRVPVTVVWRPYCASDLSGPHITPCPVFTLSNVSCGLSAVSGRLGFSELTNRRFPASEYTAAKFPGLTAR